MVRAELEAESKLSGVRFKRLMSVHGLFDALSTCDCGYWISGKLGAR